MLAYHAIRREYSDAGSVNGLLALWAFVDEETKPILARSWVLAEGKKHTCRHARPGVIVPWRRSCPLQHDGANSASRPADADVLVITQDHTTWEELEMRYRHVSISTAQLYIDSSTSGTVIENTSDALLAKISRATSLARGGHPDSRKECGVQLRDAGERFGKEMMVKGRHAKGTPPPRSATTTARCLSGSVRGSSRC